jgi:hypothetical protein
LNHNLRKENPWLFQRNSRKEIQELVFLQTEEVQSPRLHNDIKYQSLMLTKIEEVIEKQKLIEYKDYSPTSSPEGRFQFGLAKRPSRIATKEEEGSVPLSSNLHVVPHANEVDYK